MSFWRTNSRASRAKASAYSVVPALAAGALAPSLGALPAASPARSVTASLGTSIEDMVTRTTWCGVTLSLTTTRVLPEGTSLTRPTNSLDLDDVVSWGVGTCEDQMRSFLAWAWLSRPR
jgi:hypothetical protein